MSFGLLTTVTLDAVNVHPKWIIPNNVLIDMWQTLQSSYFYASDA